MLQKVELGNLCVDSYEMSAGPGPLARLKELASPLRGLRVLHVNATPYGGGVAEILRSEIPLLRDLGIDANWNTITGSRNFFEVTKTIHNGLQGSPRELTSAEQETYLTHSTRNALLLDDDYDIVIIHDPQPLALLQFHGKGDAKWLWRCHIDTSEPNEQVWKFLSDYLADYDSAVFTLDRFIPRNFPVLKAEIIPPAIDPQSPKNIAIDLGLARSVLAWIGVDVSKPLVTQVSRFDRWKDPLGVIASYRMVKREHRDLQLALVGSMALDDPEGWAVYDELLAEANADPDVHIFTNLTGVGNIEVNSFQRLSRVVIQKSLREGFGLVVSEALWKGTPVVAGNAGGIPLQMSDGAGGFLVESIEGCAERTLWLLDHPEEGHAIALEGRERVRNKFLLTRLIADELRLISRVLSQ
jgi:trehalose synthase